MFVWSSKSTGCIADIRRCAQIPKATQYADEFSLFVRVCVCVKGGPSETANTGNSPHVCVCESVCAFSPTESVHLRSHLRYSLECTKGSAR